MTDLTGTVLTPETEDELAKVVRSAHDNRTALQIRGGGTRDFGNEVRTDAVLQTGGLSGITLYDPGALTLVARAGTPLADIEAALAAEGQMLPFEPMDHRGILGTTGTPTIGGAVAVNASGPRRLKAGACRDSLIGVRFVTGEGEIIKNGGRVMKNVTGYDLVKLLAGSYGTLGVLTEVSFKVLPRPQATATLVWQGLSDVDAVAILAAAMRSPYDVSGAAHDPADGGRTYVRIEGLDQSVSYRAQALARDLASHGAAEIIADAAQITAIWAGLRDAEPLRAEQGDIWRVSVKPSDGPAVVAAAGAEAAFYDWQGGLVWLRMPQGAALRERIDGIAGHATLIRGTGQRVFQPMPMPIARLSQGLRARFDPRDILNSGKMI
ncbi:glycolate oxidase FAD binding subunit [Monaibacterium marinum]|uniref:Glycolate oxidase FAD binding subunit n=1 Tax=Pontivivens marinum TaxID=1690039 RepID=A0A2C9CVQ2_9RHOB|nr:glycolate oxidase FAD binding subunit [Monaibacterium marinum]